MDPLNFGATMSAQQCRVIVIDAIAPLNRSTPSSDCDESAPSNIGDFSEGFRELPSQIIGARSRRSFQSWSAVARGPRFHNFRQRGGHPIMTRSTTLTSCGHLISLAIISAVTKHEEEHIGSGKDPGSAKMTSRHREPSGANWEPSMRDYWRRQLFVNGTRTPTARLRFNNLPD